MITKSQAIRSLDPDSMFSIHEDVIKWDTPEISDAKINAEMARLQTEYDSKQYARTRAKVYPPITDYLDGVVKGDQVQIDKYIADCLAVKAKYPKGTK